MEKISKILPSSPRIKSVDFSDGGRVRPGMPNFGVPVGRSNPVDKFTKTNAALKLGKEFTSTDWKVRDMAKAGMVGKLSESFFTSRLEDAEEVEVVAPKFRVPEYLLEEIEEEETAPVEEEGPVIEEDESMEMVPVVLEVYEIVEEPQPEPIGTYNQAAGFEPQEADGSTIDYSV